MILRTMNSLYIEKKHLCNIKESVTDLLVYTLVQLTLYDIWSFYTIDRQRFEKMGGGSCYRFKTQFYNFIKFHFLFQSGSVQLCWFSCESTIKIIHK